MAPGTYRTRLFEPRFEFTHEKPFQTPGEITLWVSLGCEAGVGLGEAACETGVSVFDLSAFSGDVDFDRLAGSDCTTAAAVSEGSVLGVPALLLDITTGGGDFCLYLTEDPLFTWFQHETRNWLYVTERGDVDQLMVWVSAPDRGFERYIEETALPLLDSVIFLDD